MALPKGLLIRSIGLQSSLHKRWGATEAFRLRGLSPRERAKAAWARLREAKIDPITPLATMLAVELAILNDPQAERKEHFRWIQAAKLVHRMASGLHKRWERISNNGKIEVTELHKYPRSRGRVLVHIDQQLEKLAELAVDYYLDDIKNQLT